MRDLAEEKVKADAEGPRRQHAARKPKRQRQRSLPWPLRVHQAVKSSGRTKPEAETQKDDRRKRIRFSFC